MLEIAIEHLEKGKASFKTINAHLAFTCLIAFGHYMNQDFDSSLEYLDHADENAFHRDFDELIRKVA